MSDIIRPCMIESSSSISYFNYFIFISTECYKTAIYNIQFLGTIALTITEQQVKLLYICTIYSDSILWLCTYIFLLRYSILQCFNFSCLGEGNLSRGCHLRLLANVKAYVQVQFFRIPPLYSRCARQRSYIFKSFDNFGTARDNRMQFVVNGAKVVGENRLICSQPAVNLHHS